MKLPERATSRLLLRPVRIEDAAAVYGIYSRAEVCEYFDILPYTRPAQGREHVERWVRLAASGKQIRYAIEREGAVVGTCGLYSIARHQRRACLGCDLHPDHWRQGVMTEALTEFLAQCVGDWGFARIQGLVLPGNRASIALLDGLGFVEEGLLRSYEIWEGRGSVDLLSYAKVAGPGPRRATPR